MKEYNGIIVCTVEELSRKIAEEVFDRETEPPYAGYDFGLCDVDEHKLEENSLDDVYLKSTIEGWYGIHSIDTGFDAYEMMLCCDYYGGGYCPQFVTVWDDDDVKDLTLKFIGAIQRAMQSNEGVPFKSDTVLICEKQ